VIKLIVKLLIKYNKFIKFSIVGFSNLFISLAVYYILIFLSINYQIANTVGFLVATFNSYFWNKLWVFKNNKNKISDIIKFYIVCLSSWLLSTVLLYIWIQKLGISDKIAPIVNLCITTPLNYLMNKLWVFKN